MVAFGGGGLWAATAHLSSAAIAQGVIMAAGENKSIQHLEGGIVEQILVREGDSVEAGQVLIMLNKIAAEAMHRSLLLQLDQLRAVEARLLAERDEMPRIFFPRDLLQKQTDTDVASMIQGQLNEFNTRRESLASQSAIYRARIAALREEISGIKQQKASTERQLELIKVELADSRTLFSKGLAQKSKVLALERAATSLNGDRGEQTARVARAQQNITEAQAQIMAVRKDWFEKSASDLRETQGKIAVLREKVSAALDIAERTVVRAPLRGIVVKLYVHSLGAVIQSGQPLLDLLPSDTGMVVEARIKPDDIDMVSPGSDAQLRFPALRSRITPSIPGKVVYVSADRLLDATTHQPYYTARITMASELSTKVAALKIYPGMPVDVFVNTGERTPLQYLLGPLSDVIAHSWRER
jgi:HlyD family type I secretion membrane fusion protein